jgi:hypothetical protein
MSKKVKPRGKTRFEAFKDKLDERTDKITNLYDKELLNYDEIVEGRTSDTIYKVKCSCGSIKDYKDGWAFKSIKTITCNKCKDYYKTHNNIEKAKILCKEKGYQYIEENLVVRGDGRNKILYTFICPHNNTQKMCYYKMETSNCRCSVRRDMEKMKEFFMCYEKEVISYTPADTTNIQAMITIKCNKCKTIIEDQYQKLSKVPKCKCEKNGNRSVNEFSLYTMISDNHKDLELIPNSRKIIKPYEIDITIKKDDKIVLCVEWDGEYWHSSEFVKERDKIKTKMIEEKNIKFLRILDKGGANLDFVREVYNEQIKPILDLY